jgi:hypothetical protein
VKALLSLRSLTYPLVITLMIVGAVITYQAKQQAVEEAEHIADLRNEIAQERIAISLLKAEWSELTQPGRLQDLVGRYPDVLDLGAYGVERMVRIDDLPFAAGQQPDLIGEFLGGGG